ncbi:unnamed protein product [Rotaria sp. Silwood1]|nr:unnamed protein product [Rotaria sp. Silwood1]
MQASIVYSAVDSDDYLTKYIQRQSHCLDVFEQYITTLKRSFGIIREAASDAPIFDPGLTIMGPHVKKDPSVIENEESYVVKKMASIEPRKKYALVHEQIGIFIIGGYNLYVNVPIQKEPDTDYLFKFNGSTVKIPRLSPCRVHFGIYTDGDAIYVAGGQTLYNELLDDIQRLNLRTLRWEYVARLMNPIAACGMAVEGQRIYLVGGYDIFQNQTYFVNTFTIYNLLTGKYDLIFFIKKIFACGASDGRIHCWNAETGNRVCTLVSDSMSGQTIVSMNPKFMLLVSASNQLIFWLPHLDDL